MASLSSRIAPENWKVTVLPLPKGFTLARALCFGGGGILGVAEARRRPARRCLWAEGRAQPIDDPAGFEPWGGGATQLAGRRMVDGKDRATVCERRGGRWALVDLHPPGYTSSVATACADGQQVGYGQPGGQAGNPVERALLWTGAAKGVVELRGPDPARQTRALAVRDGMQVGEYGRNWSQRAAVWRSSSESMADLHPKPPKGYPPDVQVSSANGVGGGQQVGVVGWKKTTLAPQSMRAALWTGTAASFVDLTPRGFHHAWAQACMRGLQVGRVQTADQAPSRAILWSGSARDYIDLQDLLPAPWNRSWAMDITVEGSALRILGSVTHLVREGHLEVVRAERIALWEGDLGK